MKYTSALVVALATAATTVVAEPAQTSAIKNPPGVESITYDATRSVYYATLQAGGYAHGPDGQLVLAEEVRQHWKKVLSDLSLSRIYLLDHNAANYLDTLRMDVQGMPWEDRPDTDIQGYVRDVDFPRELV